MKSSIQKESMCLQMNNAMDCSGEEDASLDGGCDMLEGEMSLDDEMEDYGCDFMGDMASGAKMDLKSEPPKTEIKKPIDHTKVLDLRNYDGNWSCTQEWLNVFNMVNQELIDLNTHLKSNYSMDILAT